MRKWAIITANPWHRTECSHNHRPTHDTMRKSATITDQPMTLWGSQQQSQTNPQHPEEVSHNHRPGHATTRNSDYQFGPNVVKKFMLNVLSMIFKLLIKTKIWKITISPALKLSGVVFIWVINDKMPTIDVILTLMSMIKFMLSWVEHEKSFKTLGLDLLLPWRNSQGVSSNVGSDQLASWRKHCHTG